MTFSSLVLAAFLWFQLPGVAHIHPPAAVAIAPNGSVTATFTITVDRGFHIQSDHPQLDYLIPTTIAIDPAAGVTAGKVSWPPAQDYHFSFASEPLAVFAGSFPVTVTLKAGAASGAHRLKGTFRYQACNDQLCRPPVSENFTLPVRVGQ